MNILVTGGTGQLGLEISDWKNALVRCINSKTK